MTVIRSFTPGWVYSMVMLHNEIAVKFIVGWLKVWDDGADPEKLVSSDELMDRNWALGTTGVGKH
jgi:hypothetical protein